jgi:hypothetical protein
LYDAPQSVGSRSRNLKAAIPALLIKISIVPNSAKAFQQQYLPELISASAVIARFLPVGHVHTLSISALSSGN